MPDSAQKGINSIEPEQTEAGAMNSPLQMQTQLEEWEATHRYSLLNLKDAYHDLATCFDAEWLTSLDRVSQENYLEALGRLRFGLVFLSGVYSTNWQTNFLTEATRLAQKLPQGEQEPTLKKFLSIGGILLQFARDTNISGGEADQCAKHNAQLAQSLREQGKNDLAEILDNPYHLKEGDHILHFDKATQTIIDETIEIVDLKVGDQQVMLGDQSFGLADFNKLLMWHKYVLASGESTFGKEWITDYLAPWQPETTFHSEVRLPMHNEPLLIDGKVLGSNRDELSRRYGGIGWVQFINLYPKNQPLMTVSFEENGKVYEHVDVRLLLPVTAWQNPNEQ